MSPGNGYATYEFIYDETPPIANCVSNLTLVLDATTGAVLLNPIQLDNNSTDDETGINSTGFTASQTLFGCAHTGANTVTLTVRDKAGNSATCQTVVTVQDNTPPTLGCSNLTLHLNAQGDATVVPDQLVSVVQDACGIATFTASQTEFDCSHVGPNTVTLIATDTKGNSSTCQTVVTVVDAVPPVIHCTDYEITFNGEPNIALPLNAIATSSDACGIQSLTISPAVIPCSAVGEILTITAVTRDVNNNQSTCTSQLTVSGLPCGFNQNPDGIGCANGNTVQYDAANELFTLISSGCHYSPGATSDQLAYTGRQLCGNGEIIAKIHQLNGSGWAGLSMRESGAAGSKKAMLLLNHSNFARREIRTQTGGSTTIQQLAANGATWLRLVRSGNQISGFLSTNGQQWQLAMAANMPLPHCIDMGLVVTGILPNGTTTGVFSQVAYIGANTQAVTQHTTDPAETRPNEILAFPNPNNGLIQFRLHPEWGENTRIEIVNNTGRVVLSAQTDATVGGVHSCALPQSEYGYYYIRVTPENGLPVIGRVLVLRQ